MKHAIRLLFPLLLLAATPLVAADHQTADPWRTIVIGQESSPSEALATADLQRYLAQVSGVVPVVLPSKRWQGSPRPALLIGTPANNAALRPYARLLNSAGEEGYLLHTDRVGDATVIVAAGKTAAGAVNAIYGLLHELGFGFYLGSEAVPDRLPPALDLKAGIHRPHFRIRGVLPWYNFLNSPTTWDPVDHRAFVDQLVRMRANFIGFHTYDSEPFAAYEKNGRMTRGKRLLNTSASLWSTHPMPTAQFAGGSAQLFATDYFGAETTREPGDDVAVRREQQIMREALAYARLRGLRPCLGFEVHGDPTHPAEREDFLLRLEHVLNQYPDLDYLWLWQPEARGMRGTAIPWEQAPGGGYTTTNLLGQYGLARRELFKRAVEANGSRRYGSQDEASRLARATEGARLELYGQLACRALAKRKHAPTLVISGWGGEDRMVSAEYYEGLDKTLPKSVIFSSLEFMVPRARIDSIYSQLPPNRERWPIPWFEFDGDQWHPQSFVHTFEPMLRNVQSSGSQGILGIHWRTREVEENVAYTIQFAWNPGLSAEEFYRDYAGRCFPGPIAPAMTEVLLSLDRLGYRWVGGRGQAEYNRFSWGPGTEPEKVERLQQLQAQCRKLLPQAGRSHARLDWLINRMEYVLRFQEAGVAAVEAQKLLDEAAKAPPEQARALARQAQALLDPEKMNRALQAYSLRVSTRGEHGVLATINAKAGYEWQQMLGRASELSGQKAPEPAAWTPEPRILMPRLIGSAPEGKTLELAPIVLGARPSFVQPAYIHFRQLGKTEWSTELVSTVNRSVCFTVIPARDMVPPGVEYGFSFSSNPSEPFAFGPTAVTVMPAEPSPPGVRKATPGADGKARGDSKVGNLQLEWKDLPGSGTLLVWKDLPAADYFRVYADDQVIADVAVAFLPVRSMESARPHYVVEAWQNGKPVARGTAKGK